MITTHYDLVIPLEVKALSAAHAEVLMAWLLRTETLEFTSDCTDPNQPLGEYAVISGAPRLQVAGVTQETIQTAAPMEVILLPPEPPADPPAPKEKRHRRTKAEMEAARAPVSAVTPEATPEAPKPYEGPIALGDLCKTKIGSGHAEAFRDDGQIALRMVTGVRLGELVPFLPYELEQVQAEAPAPAGLVACQGPNAGDMLEATYCEANCAKVNGCTEYLAVKGAPPTPVKPPWLR